MTGSLPARADVAVIGGGVVGCSVAYHLAALGCRDVVLLERAKLGSGTSWHAAGNMETYRADPVLGEMVRYAVEFYPKLEAETGQALGWRRAAASCTRREGRMARIAGCGRAAPGRDRAAVAAESATSALIALDGVVGGLGPSAADNRPIWRWRWQRRPPARGQSRDMPVTTCNARRTRRAVWSPRRDRCDTESAPRAVVRR